MMCQMSYETRGFLIRPPSQCIGGGGDGGGGGGSSSGGGLFWKKSAVSFGESWWLYF